jgi:pentatricopeptide repeat protein
VGAQRNHLQRLDQCLRKGQAARAGPGAIRGNAAARRGAHVITYNALISACESSQQWELALHVFESMQQHGLHPDAIAMCC